MPTKAGRQTPQERKFVQQYVAHGNAPAAAKAAGYAHPHQAAHNVLQRPGIQADVARQQLTRLFNEVLPLAIEAHIDLLTNKATPAGARAQAVKIAYDRTIGLGDAANAKEPHEMTGEELANEIQKLKRIASDKAKQILEGDAVEVKPESGVFE